jgi:hypothetical protein
MKLDVVLLLALGFNIRIAFAQNGKCEVLRALIDDKHVRKAWLVDQNNNLPIIFIDIRGWFQNCTFSQDNYGEIMVVHDSSYLSKQSLSYIVIKDFRHNSGKYELVCYQRATNALVIADLVEDKNIMRITKVKVGHF